MKVTEGVSGLWHYHLSEDDSKTKALCGATMRESSEPLPPWGEAVK